MEKHKKRQLLLATLDEAKGGFEVEFVNYEPPQPSPKAKAKAKPKAGPLYKRCQLEFLRPDVFAKLTAPGIEEGDEESEDEVEGAEESNKEAEEEAEGEKERSENVAALDIEESDKREFEEEAGEENKKKQRRLTDDDVV